MQVFQDYKGNFARMSLKSKKFAKYEEKQLTK